MKCIIYNRKIINTVHKRRWQYCAYYYLNILYTTYVHTERVCVLNENIIIVPNSNGYNCISIGIILYYTTVDIVVVVIVAAACTHVHFITIA